MAALLAGAILHGPAAAQSAETEATRSIPSFSQPSLSPDGSQITFASGGDLWTVPAQGGAAYLLVSHAATESRPMFSPDGARLAFLSSRTGNGDIYLLTFATGEVKRLTWDDDSEQLDGWSPDGQWIYFSSTTRDMGGMNDIYRVRPEGGTPMAVTDDRYVNEYFPAVSPDGATLAFSARGIGSSQWWRNGHSHIDESEIWRLRDGKYERLQEGGAKQLWPMWSADGRQIYFTSDRGGTENLWARPAEPGGAARQLTQFTDGRLLWPTISRDGKTIVFERGLEIWSFDTTSGQAAAVPVTLQGAPASAAVEHQQISNEMEELALSPDGKKVAFTVRGEVFAVSAKDGGSAARVTSTVGPESQVVWAPDSRRIAYAADRDGKGTNLFLYDFATRAETRLTSGAVQDHSPRFSPDGKLLAFVRGTRELRLVQPDGKNERLLTAAPLDAPPLNSERPYAWSPDSRWIALVTYGERMMRNAEVVPVAGGARRPVSFIANTGGNTLSWSPDGKFLLFDTGQRTETGQLARVDLLPKTPKFREDQFRDLFQQEAPPSVKSPSEEKPEGPETSAAPADPSALVEDKDKKDGKDAKDKKKPETPEKTEIVFDGIRQRLTLVPVGVDVDTQTISPDGKWVVMTALVGNRENVYAYSLDELSREPAVAKQLTSTSGDKAQPQVTPDGKEVYYLDNGALFVVAFENPSPKPVNVTAEMDVDFAAEKLAVFDQAWRYMRDNFVDPKMHGVDWQAAYGWYRDRVAGSRTPDEMRRVVSLLIGELDASHSGIRPPFGDTVTSTGRLGLRFDREEYERSGRLKIATILPLGPVAVSRKVDVGDYLLSVDGKAVDGRTNLDQLLDYKVGRQVTLVFADKPDKAGGSGRREIQVRPVDQQTEKGLEYRRWVEGNRSYVEKVSGGRLGYVHMTDMNYSSLLQLYLDLDAQNMAKEGVVVDVRHNNGGFVSAYTIDTLARRGYVDMTFRGYPPAPSRTLLGQRALERPTILVTDQHSLSDSELLTEGYRQLKIGKVVGEPTSGWIIYTSNIPLFDGSVLRIPFIKISDSRGQDMEGNPRPVDVPVSRPVGESLTDKDTQLDVAVRELLQQLARP